MKRLALIAAVMGLAGMCLAGEGPVFTGSFTNGVTLTNTDQFSWGLVSIDVQTLGGNGGTNMCITLNNRTNTAYWTPVMLATNALTNCLSYTDGTALRRFRFRDTLKITAGLGTPSVTNYYCIVTEAK
jgi:hypothetical protein